MAVSFACPNWQEKLQQGETPIADLPLDDVEAQCAVDLFDKLRVPDIPGQPTMGEVGGEWFRDVIRAAFGSIDPISGDRFVGEVFVLVPKKNSKTTNSAALGLIALMMNRRPNIDGLIIGPTQSVAQKCFDQAAAMIEADEYLRRRFKVVEHKKTIIDLHIDEETGVQRNAKLMIKSFDPKVVTGTIPAFAIIDELHVMAESHYADRVIGQVRGGMVTNKESLLVFITTQSESQPSGVFLSELSYARDVRDGKVTEGVRMLPVLYEFAPEVQTADNKPWRDTRLWPLVLPNLGRSITIDRLIPDYQQARAKGLGEELRWASQHLNVEIGVGLKGTSWIGATHWTAAVEQDGLTLKQLIERSEVAVAGIDGGGLDDLFGLAIIGREYETKRWLCWTHAWVHPEVMNLRKEIAPKLLDFEAQGDLTICKTPTQDLNEVAQYIGLLQDAALLPEAGAVGLDPAGVAALVDELDGIGLTPQQMVAIGQGYRLSSAIWGMERKLKDGTFRHAGRPMMSWVLGNAKSEQRGSAVIITKEAAGKAKIDPLVAVFNAAMLMARNPTASGGPSVYAERGALVL